MTAVTIGQRPQGLDLFSGAGGAAMGYHRAGFDMTGVDIEPQLRYPFRFIQADAFEFLMSADLSPFAFIHASPPCQFATKMNAAHRKAGHDHHPDLLTPTLGIVRQLGIPYVIENVPAAKKWMRATLLLHGGMFGLEVYRPRIFECSELILAPPEAIPATPVGVYGQRPMSGKPWGRLNGDMKGRSLMRVATSVEEARRVMQMPWAGDWAELKEAIPPAYTEHIGRQLLDVLAATEVAP